VHSTLAKFEAGLKNSDDVGLRVDLRTELLVNGARKFTAHVVSTGKKRACQVEHIRPIQGQGRSKEDRSAGGGAAADSS